MAFPSLSPEPEPPKIPVISFQPSLQIQRQREVHEFLRAIAATPRFCGKVSRLLDIGCGEASFVRRLIPCDDGLPLKQMTGIDVDEAQASSYSWISLGHSNYKDSRWYGLDIKLLHGSFEDMQRENVGYYDAIVSVEVLEHLDPEPHARFAPVLLGRMKPKICIVTTPNREFNALFDYLDSLDPDRETQETYCRDGIPYRMRHHDHRFEWTRREFRMWALAAAEEFGYDVQFSGVGGMGRGMSISGRDDLEDILQGAANAYRSPETLPSGRSAWEELKGIVSEIDDHDEGVSDVRRVFGDCSQIAVFVIKVIADDRELEVEEEACNVGGEGLRLVHSHQFSCIQEKEFPPSLKAVLGYVMGAGRLLHLLPDPIREEWEKNSDEVLADEWHRQNNCGLFAPREDAWDVRGWKSLDDEALRVRERLFARLGGRTWEVKCVEVVLDESQLWETSYQLRLACHFSYEVFLGILNHIQARGEAPEIIIDTTVTSAECKMKVAIYPENGSTVVAATFLAAKNGVLKGRWAGGECDALTYDDGYDGYDGAGEYNGFEEYDLFEENYEFTDEDHPADNDDDTASLPGFFSKRSEASLQPEASIEFDTTIEWISHTPQERPKHCLPESPEAEGILVLCDEESEGDGMLFRVKFFAPERGPEFKLPDVGAMGIGETK